MTQSFALSIIDHDDCFVTRIAQDGQTLTRASLATLQLNLGKMCNLACHHCHVEAGPTRQEIMTWATAEKIFDWLDQHGGELDIKVVDLTGGAPEMNPSFRKIVEACRQRNLHVLDRCNLTILLEDDYNDLIDFLAHHDVEIVASLPCYLEENVDKQRGRGVYHDSIEALLKLNAEGYGQPHSNLRLDLVYNPVGYGLPPDQTKLEADYKRELQDRFGIVFNRLWTITNMPIKRFEHALHRDGQYEDYMTRLVDAHNSQNVPFVMCRDLISIGWHGAVYDCDFNQMLELSLQGPTGNEYIVESQSKKLWDFTPTELIDRPIQTASHCFGCTAGAGSSCTGSLA